MRVQRGHPFILNCTLPSSVPAVTVEWERDSTNVLLDSNRFSIYSNEIISSLIVSYYDVGDAGTYTCSMTNDLISDVNYEQEVADVSLGGSSCMCVSCICMCLWACVLLM